MREKINQFFLYILQRWYQLIPISREAALAVKRRAEIRVNILEPSMGC
jgi:hypothetical protein